MHPPQNDPRQPNLQRPWLATPTQHMSQQPQSHARPTQQYVPQQQQQPYAQPQPAYAQQGYSPSPSQLYAQQQQQAQQPYSQPTQPHYAQPHPSQPPQATYAQQQQPQNMYAQAALPSFGPSIPNINLKMPASLAGKVPSGLPAALAFPLALGAAVLALVFDIVFLNVNIPGIGGYAWYLSTALTFAGAGYAGAKFTKATRTAAMTALGFGAAVYGFLDLGMGVAMEHMAVGDALFLGVQGVVIAVFTGFGGVYRGLRAKG